MKPLGPVAPLLAHPASWSCPVDSPFSCHNTTAVVDFCCFIPAGQLLQTQFWDTDPPTGPSGAYRPLPKPAPRIGVARVVGRADEDPRPTTGAVPRHAPARRPVC